MKKLIYLIMLCAIPILSIGQTPHNDLNTSLFANFDPWCTIFQTNTGSPTSAGILMGHSLFNGGDENSGESIVADFNFIEGASYIVDVNISEFNLSQNLSGQVKVILVNDPAKIGCIGTPFFSPPTPSFPGHFVLAEHTVSQSIFSDRNIRIQFRSPDNFNSIVIFPQDLDPATHPIPHPAEVHLWLNCVKINLLCYTDQDKTFASNIPNGADGANNFFIGSSFGNNPNGVAINTNGVPTDFRASESIILDDNTTITPSSRDFFLAHIYPCGFPYHFEFEPEVIIEDFNACGIATITDGSEEDTYDRSSYNSKSSFQEQVVSEDEYTLTNKLSLENQIEIYPNPVSESLNFNLPKKEGLIEMYNRLGQLVKTKKIESLNEQMDVSGFNPGVYLVRIVDKDHNMLSEEKIMVH